MMSVFRSYKIYIKDSLDYINFLVVYSITTNLGCT